MKERGGVMKVIFGGAFNPVTKAHMQVYEYVMSRVGADDWRVVASECCKGQGFIVASDEVR